MAQKQVESRLIAYHQTSLFDGTQKILFAVSTLISLALVNTLFSLWGPDVIFLAFMLLILLLWAIVSEVPKTFIRRHPSGEWALNFLYLVGFIGSTLLFMVVQYVLVLLNLVFTSGRINAITGIVLTLVLLQTLVFAAIRLELTSVHKSHTRHLNNIQDHVTRVIAMYHMGAGPVRASRVKAHPV